MGKLREAKDRDRTANTDADVECHAGDELAKTKVVEAFTSPVRISVTHYRKKLADPDGLSTKAAVDGIVKLGILADDSTKEIQEPILHRQVKIQESDVERTVFEIEEA